MTSWFLCEDMFATSCYIFVYLLCFIAILSKRHSNSFSIWFFFDKFQYMVELGILNMLYNLNMTRGFYLFIVLRLLAISDINTS